MSQLEVTPQESAIALRAAAAWLKSGSRRHIRGRRIKRVEGYLYQTGEDGDPEAVCALGAAVYALGYEQEIGTHGTAEAIGLLACRDAEARRLLFAVPQLFDEGVEERKREPLRLAMNKLLAAAERLDALVTRQSKKSTDKRQQ